MLIENILAPGFLSWISVSLAVLPPHNVAKDQSWDGDYELEWDWCQSQQFETTVDMTKLRDMTYYDVCQLIYENYGALLIGIRSPSSQGFILFPQKSYKLQYGDQGVFIFRQGKRHLQACVDSPILFQQLKTYAYCWNKQDSIRSNALGKCLLDSNRKRANWRVTTRRWARSLRTSTKVRALVRCIDKCFVRVGC